MPKRRPESSKRQPPKAIILEEFSLMPDPWRSLKGKPGIKIISTTRRMPGE